MSQTLLDPVCGNYREGWARIMQQCIALNASFFNTHWTVRQCLLHAYWLEEIVPTGGPS